MKASDISLKTIIMKMGNFDIYLATKEGEEKNYALWIEDFSKISNKKILKHLNNQLFIIKTLNHPNVLKFFENIKENRKVYVITEYYNGGTLRDFLDKYLQEHNKPPSEEIVQYIMRQIIEGVKYLHNKKIFHRDLKLEYIMLNYEDEKDKENNNIMKAKIIISDFFSAGYFKKGRYYNEIIGTPGYMEPGILNKMLKSDSYDFYEYNEKCDIWSLGIIFFELLMGYHPFNSANNDELLDKVNKGDYYISMNLSKEAVSFLNCMLQYYPPKRVSIDILYKHRFLRRDINKFKKLDLNKIKSCIVISKIKLNTRAEKSSKNFIDFNVDFNSDSEEEIETINPENKKQILDDMFLNAIQEKQNDPIIIEPKLIPFMLGDNSEIHKDFNTNF